MHQRFATEGRSTLCSSSTISDTEFKTSLFFPEPPDFLHAQREPHSNKLHVQ